MDAIFIKDLRLELSVGITEPERAAKQTVLINVELGADTRKAAQSGDIADAVNYYDVAKSIEEMTQHRHFDLIETLAEEIADLCLDMDGVKHAVITVEKPNIMSDICNSVGVKIERKA